jgi:hypothetical protein
MTKLTTIPPALRGNEAKRILNTVQRHFAVLEPIWCSGIGLRLQRTDSDMCAVIQRRLRAQGLPVLSIHDSFISWARVEPQLRIAMQEAFAAAWKKAS